MAVNGVPDITYIDQFIEDGEKSTLMLRNFYETILVTNPDDETDMFRSPLNDFFIKYRDALADAEQFYSLPQSLFYKPKQLSYALYGTTELWLALMRLNGFRNITEFHMPIIKIYNPAELLELVTIFFKREGVV